MFVCSFVFNVPTRVLEMLPSTLMCDINLGYSFWWVNPYFPTKIQRILSFLANSFYSTGGDFIVLVSCVGGTQLYALPCVKPVPRFSSQVSVEYPSLYVTYPVLICQCFVKLGLPTSPCT